MILGIDEAGRGPVLGPLVVAALAWNGEDELEEMGVKDSKLLSPSRRACLFNRLREIGGHCIMEISAEGIDEARRRMTINHLEVLAFSSVLSSISQNTEVLHPDLPSGCTLSMEAAPSRIDHVIVDAADTNADRFGKRILHFHNELTGGSSISITSMHKADLHHPVVGGASILAKVTRDMKISELEAEVGRKIGSGYPGDPVTREFLGSWVREFGRFPHFARRSWKTCLAFSPEQRKLSDYRS